MRRQADDPDAVGKNQQRVNKYNLLTGNPDNICFPYILRRQICHIANDNTDRQYALKTYHMPAQISVC